VKATWNSERGENREVLVKKFCHFPSEEGVKGSFQKQYACHLKHFVFSRNSVISLVRNQPAWDPSPPLPKGGYYNPHKFLMTIFRHAEALLLQDLH
jgi:hypothetical protein